MAFAATAAVPCQRRWKLAQVVPMGRSGAGVASVYGGCEARGRQGEGVVGQHEDREQGKSQMSHSDASSTRWTFSLTLTPPAPKISTSFQFLLAYHRRGVA